jgi:SAM-dependent methyltransferase
MKRFPLFLKALWKVLLFILALSLLHFPFDTDSPLSSAEIHALRDYYADAYKKASNTRDEVPSSTDETRYVLYAEAAAHGGEIEKRISDFVRDYGLLDRPVLDIGSGRGYLQDFANDYTGLDVSSTAGRFYHKKFVQASATAMPFPDNSFDGAWSIFVLEHVPNPEQMLSETRRVLRDGAVLFLMPAWNVPPWRADGYEVRPYGDFGPLGMLIKASIPVRSSQLFMATTLLPIRIMRAVAAQTGPTHLHYRRLKPNYEHYWTNDSDAVNSIDVHEALLWFLSRGDECLNCKGPAVLSHMIDLPFVIRVRK